ncbi:MAG: hypothetical protein KBC84_03630 [Proteobacteria bacterium]|nr:hypothetical protein [Pseudomonadota bacterium]
MNKHISKTLFFFFLSTVLYSCGPIYDTQYQFIPPDSPQGRACIYQCENSKSQCHELERYRSDDCEYRAKLDQQRCEDDVWRRTGKAPKWYECGAESCSPNSDRCDGDYRHCYEMCGGRVDARTVCVANCQAVPPNAPTNTAPVYKENYREPSPRRY